MTTQVLGLRPGCEVDGQARSLSDPGTMNTDKGLTLKACICPSTTLPVRYTHHWYCVIARTTPIQETHIDNTSMTCMRCSSSAMVSVWRIVSPLSRSSSSLRPCIAATLAAYSSSKASACNHINPSDASIPVVSSHHREGSTFTLWYIISS